MQLTITLTRNDLPVMFIIIGAWGIHVSVVRKRRVAAHRGFDDVWYNISLGRELKGVFGQIYILGVDKCWGYFPTQDVSFAKLLYHI